MFKIQTQTVILLCEQVFSIFLCTGEYVLIEIISFKITRCKLTEVTGPPNTMLITLPRGYEKCPFGSLLSFIHIMYFHASGTSLVGYDDMWRQPRVSIYRKCEGFKNSENHNFKKLTKFAKLQYFEPFHFL